MSPPLHARLISRAALALGLVALEVLLAGHMALERHTVSTSGSVVELHASLDLHTHGDRSLCERTAGDDGASDDLCHGSPETLNLTAHADRPPAPIASAGAALVEHDAYGQHVALWLTAPKASPPAQG